MYNGLTVPILLLKHNGEKYSPVSSVMPGYGPFLEMDAAIAELTSEFRGIENVPVGYTFCLIENDKPVEYWFTKAGNPESIEKKVIVSSDDSPSIQVDSLWEKSGSGLKIKGANNIVEDSTNGVSVGSGNTVSGKDTFAEGTNNKVSGNSSHVEGIKNEASGVSSHAEGNKTTATGKNSHSEGNETLAAGENSHSEGDSNYIELKPFGLGNAKSYTGTIISDNIDSVDEILSTPEGIAALKLSYITDKNNIKVAITDATYESSEKVLIFQTKETLSATQLKAEKSFFIAFSGATGKNAHAENSLAAGEGSHAEGINSFAGGKGSHSEGNLAQAKGKASHAEGYNTEATGKYSHAEGANAKSIGSNSHAEGYNALATGFGAHAEGSGEDVVGVVCEAKIDIVGNGPTYSTYWGGENARVLIPGNIVEYNGVFATVVSVGDNTVTLDKSLGDFSEIVYLNEYSNAKGDYSHVEGLSTTALGQMSHAEGYSTIASGDYGAHAEGDEAIASGDGSHAEGYITKASGRNSHAEGFATKSVGFYSHAEGNRTESNGESSHAEGVGTKTMNEGEHACGKYNKTKQGQLFSIGFGGDDNTRKNAVEVTDNGGVYVKGIGYFTGENGENRYSLAEAINQLARNTAVDIALNSTFDDLQAVDNELKSIGGVNIISRITSVMQQLPAFNILATQYPSIILVDNNRDTKVFYLQSIQSNINRPNTPKTYTYISFGVSSNWYLEFDSDNSVQLQNV